MIRPFRQVLDGLENAFRRLEEQAPYPEKVPYADGFKLRYKERTPHQALLQKFARQISGLYAIDLLLEAGFCQEQGVIQRTLDDIEEDIMFLTLALAKDEWTENHKLYLEYFWQEEPGAGMVRRDKIRAYVNNAGGIGDPSSANDAGRAVFKAYSGYVHAASVNVVDMCHGDPPRFHLAGMRDHPLYDDHAQDAWNYFYRGLVSATFMAKAFEDADLWQQSFAAVKRFEVDYSEVIFPVSGKAD